MINLRITKKSDLLSISDCLLYNQPEPPEPTSLASRLENFAKAWEG